MNLICFVWRSSCFLSPFYFYFFYFWNVKINVSISFGYVFVAATSLVAIVVDCSRKRDTVVRHSLSVKIGRSIYLYTTCSKI